MRPLKIAMVSTTDMAMRCLLLDQVRCLQEQGHEVVAVCGPGRWVAELRDCGVRVEVIKMSRNVSPLRDAISFAALVRYFRRGRFDVVHTHTPKAGLLGPMAARVAGVPVVIHTIHGLLFHDRMPWWRRGLFWLPEKWTASCGHLLLSQSKEDVGTATRSRLCSANKIKYLGNGIDTEVFSPAAAKWARSAIRAEMGFADTDVVIGTVGRLVYEKGLGELFATAEELTSKHKTWKFLVVGPGEAGQRRGAVPAGRIEALRASGSVFFADWRENVSHWLAAMDIFVLPSHREGVPRACMEAASMELPVIATDIRGCREVVNDNQTGFLVPLKDRKALARAIETLAGDEQLRRRFGAEGRPHILKNFDRKLVLERLRNCYSRIQLELEAYGEFNGAGHEPNLRSS